MKLRNCLLLLSLAASASPLGINGGLFGGASNPFKDLFDKGSFSKLLGGGVNNQPASDNAQSFCGAQSQADGSAKPLSDVLSDTCRSEDIDLVFLVDGSGSVQESNFRKVKDFVARIVENMDIGRDRSRVALVQFSSDVRVEFDLDDNTDQSSVMRAIQRMRYMSASTETADGLRAVREEVLQASRGHRSNVPTVVITITDGRGQGDIRGESNRLRAMDGVTSLAVGIEPKQKSSSGLFAEFSKLLGMKSKPTLDQDQLLDIAGDKERVFVVCDFERLDRELMEAITTSICNEVDTECRRTFNDVVYLVDGSGSVGSQNFANLKGFLQLLAKSHAVGPAQSRLGLLTFSNDPDKVFDLSDDPAFVDREIAGMDYRRGKTYLGEALRFTKREMYDSRRNKDNAPILIVFTDGKPTDDAEVGPAVRALADDGVTIFAVGVGDGIDERTLEKISGDRKRVIQVQDFDKLDAQTKNAISSLVCKEKPKEGSSGSGSSGGSEGSSGSGSGSLSSAEGFEYLGCFERRSPALFARSMGRDNFRNNPRACFEKCSDSGFDTEAIALEGKGLCYCGRFEELVDGEEADRSTSCNLKCETPAKNRDGVVCGGGRYISVYSKESRRWRSFKESRGSGSVTIDGGDASGEVSVDGGGSSRGGSGRGSGRAGGRVGGRWRPNRGRGGSNGGLDGDDRNGGRWGGRNGRRGGARGVNRGRVTGRGVNRGGNRGRGSGGRGSGGSSGSGSGGDCESTPLDVYFVVDGSSSIEEEDFDRVKDFIKAIARQADLGEDKTRIAVQQFTERAYEEVHLKDSANVEDFVSRVDRIDHRGGETKLDVALLNIRDEMRFSRNGGRGRRVGANPGGAEGVVVVITDGESLGDPARAARQLKKADPNMEIVAIGVGGDRAMRRQLQEVTGSRDLVHDIDSFSELIRIESKRRADAQACEGPLGPLTAGLKGSAGRRSRSGRKVTTNNGRRTGSSRGFTSTRTRVSTSNRNNRNNRNRGSNRNRAGSRRSGRGGRRVSCKNTDIVFGIDKSFRRGSSEWRRAVALMRALTSRMQRGDTRFAIFNVPKSSPRTVTILHAFEEDQRRKNLESEYSEANQRRGTEDWAELKAEVAAKAEDEERDVAVVYFGARASAGLPDYLREDLAELGEGARIVPVSTHRRALRGNAKTELDGLASEGSVLKQPNVKELLDAIQCNED